MLDIEKTAAALSQELAAGRELRRFAKASAVGLPDWAQGLADRWSQLSPTSKGLLAGTAGGALLGGVSSLGREKEERQPFQSALSGAMAGGLLGGGLGLAAQYGPDWIRQLPQKTREMLQPTKKPSAPTGVSPLDPAVIAKMTPEELARIDPKALSQSSLEAINAVEARQQQLIEQARENAASPLVRGTIGGAAAGTAVAGAEKLRRGYKTHSLLGEPTDVARAWSELPAKDRAAMPMSLEDAEALAKKIVQDAKSQKYPLSPNARKYGIKNLWQRLRRGFHRPNLPAFPDKQIQTVLDSGKSVTRTARSEEELVRRLLQEGRAARLGRFPKLRSVGYGLGALAAVLAGLYSANRAKAHAAERMARKLRIQ